MRIGMVGLGRMGGNMARRLLRGGHEVVGYATDAAAMAQLTGDGGIGTSALADMVAKLRAPRAVWVMVPAGEPTEQVVMDLRERLERGDTVIDGGNSYFKDDVRRMPDARRARHPLRRRGHQRRRLGPRARLLPDDRRRAGRGRSASIRSSARWPPGGRHPAHAGPRAGRGTAEEGYLHCGPSGAGPLRQDDPQRHRVRPDAGLRRGLRHLQERDLEGPARGAALRPGHRRHRRALAARAAWSARGCST